MDRCRLLIAEDCPEHQRVLLRALCEAAPGARVRTASTRQEFLQEIRHGQFDCVVIDFSLGASTLLREAAADLCDTPAVVISASDEQSVVIESLRRGAADYLPKAEALAGDALWRRVQAAIERARSAKLDRRRASRRERALRRAAETDALTGLYNRRFATRALHSERVRHDRREHTACVMLDIDHFKGINDRLGHAAGDAVLARVAAIVREQAGAADTPVRWGGEEFLVLRPSVSLAEAWCWADGLRRRLAAAPMKAGGERVRITVSGGVALVPTRDLCEHSVTLADGALYLAKEHGRDRVCTADMARMLEVAESCRGEAAERAPERARRFLGAIDAGLGPVQKEHTGAHAQRVSELSAGLARAVNLPAADAAAAEHAALLHDLGKVGVPEPLLAQPRPYTCAEREFVGEHARFSGDLAEALAMPGAVVSAVREQHRRYDSGAPAGGVIAVADAYDAMTTGRPHAAGKTPEQALAELRHQRGRQFDPDAVDGMHFVKPRLGLAA